MDIENSHKRKRHGGTKKVSQDESELDTIDLTVDEDWDPKASPPTKKWKKGEVDQNAPEIQEDPEAESAEDSEEEKEGNSKKPETPKNKGEEEKTAKAEKSLAPPYCPICKLRQDNAEGEDRAANDSGLLEHSYLRRKGCQTCCHTTAGAFSVVFFGQMTWTLGEKVVVGNPGDPIFTFILSHMEFIEYFIEKMKPLPNRTDYEPEAYKTFFTTLSFNGSETIELRPTRQITWNTNKWSLKNDTESPWILDVGKEFLSNGELPCNPLDLGDETSVDYNSKLFMHRPELALLWKEIETFVIKALNLWDVGMRTAEGKVIAQNKESIERMIDEGEISVDCSDMAILIARAKCVRRLYHSTFYYKAVDKREIIETTIMDYVKRRAKLEAKRKAKEEKA